MPPYPLARVTELRREFVLTVDANLTVTGADPVADALLGRTIGRPVTSCAAPGGEMKLDALVRQARRERISGWEAAMLIRGVPATILLVEDNPDSREVLGAWLTELGHQVRVASDGAEAIAIARRQRPEIVLLDIGLPGMDGYQGARALRDQPETRDALLIAVTGYGRPEDFVRARDAGFDGHIVKPVQPDALARLIHMPRRLVRSLMAQRRT